MTNQEKNGTIKLDGETIKWVENFKYLGSMMLSSETDIKIRKGQAWGAFWKMKDIWKSMKYNEKIMKLGKSALQAKGNLTCFYEKYLELIKLL